MLGKFRYGPEYMNVVGDRHQVGSLSAVGWDDEGVQPEEFHIVRNGLVNDYQTTREQAMWLDWWYKSQGRETRSHGCSYAQSWADVQFQRMPNVSLRPGEKPLTPAQMVAGVDKGIYIIENLNLEELAAARCYSFAFIGIPLKLNGATGSPLRPLALA